MTLTHLEVEVFAGFEMDLPCVIQGCPFPAEWQGVYRVCRHFHLWCNRHKEQTDIKVAVARVSARKFIHNCCKTENYEGLDWRKL